MNELPVSLTCPLGHQCEKAIDGGIERCNWYTRLEGTNPQTGDRQDEYGCAMAWLPILLIENAQSSKGTSVAIESFRNAVLEAQAVQQRLT